MDNTKEVETVVSNKELIRGFEELGLKKGDIVEVHSSLKSIGRVDGGATIVVEAIMETVGKEGSIVMSAYPVSAPIELTAEEKKRGIQWKVRILPQDTDQKSSLGAVVDNFIKRPDVKMGKGLHRVAAWGNNAFELINGYQTLLDMDGVVLLIGVGIDRCSSMHIAEEVPIPEDIAKLTEVPGDILKDYDPTQWSLGYGGTPEDAWQKVYKKVEQKGLVKHTKIGNADCYLFKAKDLVDIFKEWRKNDPYRLYGVDKPI